MVQQLSIIILLVIAVVGLFQLKELWLGYLYGQRGDAEAGLQQLQTDRQRVRQGAWIGAGVGASVMLAVMIIIVALAVQSTGHPPSGHIGWSIFVAAVFVPGGALFGSVVGAWIVWFRILLQNRQQ